MLRINTHNEDRLTVLQLEGRLAGPWVAVMRDCWERQLTRSGGHAIQVDLRAVTFVDAEGRALLAEMTGQHAKLVAGDCQMRAILAEIARPWGDTL